MILTILSIFLIVIGYILIIIPEPATSVAGLIIGGIGILILITQVIRILPFLLIGFTLYIIYKIYKMIKK